MNGSTLNYNVTPGATHKFYCSTAVCATISSTATTFNNAGTCGSNCFTCTTGTLGGNTIATTNLIPSLTGYLKQATSLTPVYYNAERNIVLGCDSANNSYMHGFSLSQHRDR